MPHSFARHLLSRRNALFAIAGLAGSCARKQESETVTSARAPVPSSAPRLSPSAPPSVSVPTASATSSASAPPAASFEAPTGPDRIDVSTVFLDASQGGPQWIRIARPAWDAGAGFPLLIALHGLGEAQKGREPGSWGWIRDYKLDQAMIALRRGSLTAAHFQGFVTPKRLGQINKSLRTHPFRGVVVACPYTPDLITEKSLDNTEPFASLLLERLLPRIRKEVSVLGAPESTGIDGVSLGGRLALLLGLAHKDAFGAVGSMQTAIEGQEIAEIVRRAKAAWQGPLPRVRLLTSDKDFYREAVESLHRELLAAHVKHEYMFLPGPHAYAFNRGPGSLEMLLWHDRVLRRS